MRNLIIAMALSFVSSTAFANGFSPWDSRGVVGEHQHSDSVDLIGKSIGFAPWATRGNRAVFANEKGIAIELIEPNIFRPWS